MTGKEFYEKWPALYACLRDLDEDTSWEDIEEAIKKDMVKQKGETK